MLTTIKLKGVLGRTFQKEFELQVDSVATAIRAISANFPLFRQHILAKKNYYKIIVDKSVVSASELTLTKKSGIKSITIIPVVEGSGKLGKVIIGAVLLFVAYQTGFGFNDVTGQLTTAGGFLSSAGTSLLIGGIMELLFKPPVAEYSEAGNVESYNFNGPVNTTAQGKPVPVGYGQVLVGSAIIGAGIHTT